MDPKPVILLAATVLALPGPTNALLAIAGATKGFKRSLRLVLAVLAGYAAGIVGLAAVAAPLIAAYPWSGKVLRLLAAAVLVHAALRLWRLSTAERNIPIQKTQEANTISWWHVFLTTLTNPKVLVLGVLILPERGASPYSVPSSAAMIPLLVVLTSSTWIAIGAGVKSGLTSIAAAGWIERSGAVVLLLFASVFASSALSITPW